LGEGELPAPDYIFREEALTVGETTVYGAERECDDDEILVAHCRLARTRGGLDVRRLRTLPSPEVAGRLQFPRPGCGPPAPRH
jgi:hypothetical protein